jgi:two-component system response regulator PilR (NtrC family)
MVGGRERDGCGGRGSVLVFDEETVILDLLALVLTREGYQVTTTARHEEALEFFSGGTFDLAIADLGLHNGNGRRLVQEIKEISPETAIVSMAAYPAGEIQGFAEKHTEAFLAKPFGMNELLAAVRSALGRGSVKESGPDRGFALRQGLPVAAVSG